MGSDRDTLLGMGFDSARVEWALKATGNRGLQPAMDHILENEGKSVPDMSAVSESAAPARSGGADAMDEDDEDAEVLRGHAGGAAGDASAGDAEAKSIKCSICNKTFRNTALANYHAEKSGHDQFEESTEELKPLTEEEKKQKLEELRLKMAEKKMAKAKEEAKEQKANEEIRRKSGKDMNQIREELKVKEHLKDMEAKKREKIEEAKARAAVKAQIEADKKARAEKAAREKALREGQPIIDQHQASSSSAPKPAATTGVSGKDFPETRLQIRLASGGQPLTTTLPSDSTLERVAEYVASQDISFDVESITFTQSFPRKTFSKADLSRTLKELGLTPSAVLIAS